MTLPHRTSMGSAQGRSHSSRRGYVEGEWGARWVIWSVLLGLVVFVSWAHWAVLDEVTRAPGAVIASSRTQVIQSLEGGTIQEIQVREGDIVEAGQVLLSFDRKRVQAAFLEAQSKAVGLRATVARLNAEVLGTQVRFSEDIKLYPEFEQNQRQLMQRRLSAIREEIGALNELAKLTQDELDMTTPLLATGDVSRTEVLRLQRQLADLRAQMVNKRNRFLQEAQAELADAQEQLAAVEQTLAQRQSQLDQVEVLSPVRGVVNNVRFTTRGGVVRPGEEIMHIVPLDDDLVVEARVPPSDIAFLQRGLSGSIKIDAYDYTVYGDLPGELVYISPDTLTEELQQGESPYYRVRMKATSRQFSGRPDARLEIQPGMTATVEVQTGQRTVWQYITKPVIKTMSEALGER